MKALMLFMLLLFAAPVAAFDSCLTGAWVDLDYNGEGLVLLETESSGVIGFFYTYAPGDRHVYYVVPFDADGMADMFATVAGGASEHEVGAAMFIEFGDTLLFSYEVVLDLTERNPDVVIPWCLGERCSGERTFVRLTMPVTCEGG